MHDFRTIQDHDAPHTTSDLLFKGVVQESAQSVYTGLIRVREHARGTARLPDESQPHAGRARVGVERAQPRHPHQRREVQPRLHGRADRSRAPLLPGESWRAHQHRRPPDRARLLRRGARPTPGAGARRAVADAVSPRSSTPDGSRWVRRDDVGHDRPRRAHVRRGHPGDAGRRRRGRGENRRRRVRDRRRLQPRQRVAVGGRGVSDEREIECPQHGSTFSLTTGEACTLPATQPVPVFDVVVADGMVTISRRVEETA